MSIARKRNQILCVLGLAALLSAALPPLIAGLRTPTAPIILTPPQGVDFDKLPLSFEPNKGQTDPSVRYMTHTSDGTMYFMPSEVLLALQSGPSVSKHQPSDEKAPVDLASLSALSPLSSTPISAQPTEALPTTSVVRLQFIGSNPDTVMSSGEALPGKVNYFIGSDPSKWHTDVPTYDATYYENLYPGIDLKYEGTGVQLKGTYTVAPGADSSLIQWRYSEAQSVRIDQAGNLQVVVGGNDGTSGVTVVEQAPIAWQTIGGKRHDIAVTYALTNDGTVSFALGNYEPAYPLTIDPALELYYSTYLGGSGSDSARGVAVDSDGNIYVTGLTYSNNFPLRNAYRTYQLSGDAFITKLDTNASGDLSLVYSTYLGGSAISDMGTEIEVDSAGNAYVIGTTRSADFPIVNGYQTVHRAIEDVFLAKLHPSGSQLLYSTFLGGGAEDYSAGLAIDGSGIAYLSGTTYSQDFPVRNPLQTDGVGYDVFVAKLDTNSSGNQSLLYSTYLQGNHDEWGSGMALDALGNMYVTGWTQSTNFPLVNPYQANLGGAIDAFVTKLNSAGSVLLYSTFLGGNDIDRGRDITVDLLGNAYVAGESLSTDFPIRNQFQADQAGNDLFVTRLNTNSSGDPSLVYSTYLGGNANDQAWGIDTDGAGNAYVVGNSQSADFPLRDQYQGYNYYDAVVAKLNTNSSGDPSLVYSTYLGGSLNETGYEIKVDSEGNAYVVGWTASQDFPLMRPYQSQYRGGSSEVFVSRIQIGPLSTLTATPLVTPIRTATPTPTYVCALSWHVVPPQSAGLLDDIDALASNDVWAVGQTSDGRALMRHWNGFEWAEFTLPIASTLRGVVAVASDDVWAVGYTGETLIVHWDGLSWSIVPSPNPGNNENRLYAITANSANDIWAVGYRKSINGQQNPLTLRWNGTSWMDVPTPATERAYLYGVTAISANDAWVVGSHFTLGTFLPLTMHWDGSQWSIVNTPYYSYSTLYGVDAVSSTDVWAVGTLSGGNNLVLRWNGSQWMQFSVPSPGPNSNSIHAIDAIAANDIWVVGGYSTSSGGAWRELIMHWNGTSWRTFPGPNVGTPSYLYGVSAVSSEEVWAGGKSGSISSQVLVERYRDLCSSTPTVTGTPPSATPSRTSVPPTPTRTPVTCGQESNYYATQSTGATIVPGTVLIPGSNCDDCVLSRTLPFTFNLYGQSFNTTLIGSNGTIGFLTNPNLPDSTCLPHASYVLFPNWINLDMSEYLPSGLGIFTSISGSAPNRIYNIEWRACHYHYQSICTGRANFEVRLYESQSRFDFIYGQVDSSGYYSTVGVQRDLWNYTQFSCRQTLLSPGLQLSFTQQLCPIGTPSPVTSTPTGTPSITPMPSNTPTVIRTTIPSPSSVFTNTPTPGATHTSIPVPSGTTTSMPTVPTSTISPPPTAASCSLQFVDVPEGHTFYSSVRCLVCRGILSGYSNGTFRPDNLVTRGQLAKIVSNAANFTEDSGTQIFQDVPPDHTFYEWINRLTNRGYMSGYTCGSPGEPCVNSRPYFRPFANATRAQTSKIVSNAAQYNDPPQGQSFEDVPPTHPFYEWIQRIATRGIIGGYQCGGVGEPCVNNRSYFRPYNNVTRGQSAKIVANTFYPDCQTLPLP